MESVAVFIGDGVHKDAVQWPEHVKVVHFRHPRDTKSLAEKAKRGSFSVVFLHTKSTYPEARRVIRMVATCKVVEFSNSPAQMSKEIGDMFQRQSTKPTAQNSVRPFVRVAEASKRPERRPSWTDDEHAALLMAYEGAFDLGKFIEQFLSLTEEMNVPARSQSEIRTELERLKSGGQEQASDPWCFLVSIHAVSLVHVAIAQWKEQKAEIRSKVMEVVSSL